MRNIAFLLAATLALASPGAAADMGRPIFRTAATVTLSNGQVVPVFSTVMSMPTERVSTMLISTENGTVVAEERYDKTWDTTFLTFRSGDQTITLRYQLGFFTAGLHTPMELRIGTTIYRWYWKDSEVSPQQRAAQKAVAALPENTRRDLVTFALLYDAAIAELMAPTSGGAVYTLFADTLPRVGLMSIEPLSVDDATRLFRESSGQKK